MNNNPPRLFLKFFRWYCHSELVTPIEGDLMELYDERVKELGKKKADRKFIKDVIMLFRKDIIKPADGTRKLNYYGMFKNYFKVGIRNILKYKLFSFINVFGLAVAMSVCMLIILMLADQKSYDQFHTNKDRIYRLLGTPLIGSMPYATIPMPIGEVLTEEYPIVEKAVTLRRGVGGDASFNQKTVEVRGYFTSNSFLDVFSFPLVKGDRLTALSEPNSIVLSKEKAYQLFNDQNPVGEQISFADRGLNIMEIEPGSPPEDWGTYTVTGVIDLSSNKSHLTFDGLVSSSTLPQLYKDSLMGDVSKNWEYYWSSYAYVQLKEGIEQHELNTALQEIAKRQYIDSEKLSEFQFSAQNLNELTPGIPVNNEPKFRLPEIGYYILSILALIIMVMACLNYTNLSVARSLTRMKEIGVRKVNGASRKNLIFQFLTESVITVFFALFVALIMLYFTKEAFMNLWFNKYLNFDLTSTPDVIPQFIVFAVLVGLIAGTYPALFLSKRMPVKALKNNISSGGKWTLQKVLNVSQFVVSLCFIVTSIVIYDQFKHYTSFEYGFDSENIINIPLQSNDIDMVVNEFSQVPGVTNISACDYIPATGITNIIELRNQEEGEDPHILLNYYVDENFIDNLDLKVLHGQSFSALRKEGKYILINESAVKKLGYTNPQEAIGQVWKFENNESSTQIIGVVENFRATLLINGDEIRPMALSNDKSRLSYLNVRISKGNPLATIAGLKEEWKQIDGVHEFKYDFFDDELANTNLVIFDVVSIIGYIAFLAILIACLGLLGMATYATERKTKEVGIRKVLGATEQAIIFILSKAFLKLLAISIIIAAPLSYLINRMWLDELPNRVEFGFETVIIGSLLMLGLGLLTIGSQTLRAARQNPIESLKDE